MPERIGKMTLSRVDSGEVTLKAIRGGRGLRARLYSFGLTPGARFSVLRREGCGRLTIRVRDSVFALGQGMAEKMVVE
jgi:Fe2+ transport system protein FeoA